MQSSAAELKRTETTVTLMSSPITRPGLKVVVKTPVEAGAVARPPGASGADGAGGGAGNGGGKLTLKKRYQTEVVRPERRERVPDVAQMIKEERLQVVRGGHKGRLTLVVDELGPMVTGSLEELARQIKIGSNVETTSSGEGKEVVRVAYGTCVFAPRLTRAESEAIVAHALGEFQRKNPNHRDVVLHKTERDLLRQQLLGCLAKEVKKRRGNKSGRALKAELLWTAAQRLHNRHVRAAAAAAAEHKAATGSRKDKHGKSKNKDKAKKAEGKNEDQSKEAPRGDPTAEATIDVTAVREAFVSKFCQVANSLAEQRDQARAFIGDLTGTRPTGATATAGGHAAAARDDSEGEMELHVLVATRGGGDNETEPELRWARVMARGADTVATLKAKVAEWMATQGCQSASGSVKAGSGSLVWHKQLLSDNEAKLSECGLCPGAVLCAESLRLAARLARGLGDSSLRHQDARGRRWTEMERAYRTQLAVAVAQAQAYKETERQRHVAALTDDEIRRQATQSALRVAHGEVGRQVLNHYNRERHAADEKEHKGKSDEDKEAMMDEAAAAMLLAGNTALLALAQRLLPEVQRFFETRALVLRVDEINRLTTAPKGSGTMTTTTSPKGAAATSKSTETHSLERTLALVFTQ